MGRIQGDAGTPRLLLAALLLTGVGVVATGAWAISVQRHARPPAMHAVRHPSHHPARNGSPAAGKLTATAAPASGTAVASSLLPGSMAAPNVAVPRSGDDEVWTTSLRASDAGLAVQGNITFNLTAHLLTEYGTLVWGLHERAAPQSVANFAALVRGGFYNSSCIYRYEKGFVLQGGGCAGRASPKTVPLEYNLPNVKHSVALARSSDPHSGGSEWFINLRDNTGSLGPRKKGGYAVFAHVLAGFHAMEAIKALPTTKGKLTTFNKPQPKILHAFVVDHRRNVTRA